MDDEFFARGIQLVVDGHEPQAVEDILYLEIGKIQERHKSIVFLRVLVNWLLHLE